MPAPRANTVLYHGVLAGHASRRAAVAASAEHASRPRNASWAERMRRSFGLDVLACPDCGGRMRYLATIFAADGLHRMLRAKGLPDEALPIRPARAPPEQLEASFDPRRGDVGQCRGGAPSAPARTAKRTPYRASSARPIALR